MNKNNRKDLLYYEAFKLFLQHQYDGVSLNDIEKATNMTRGAIFYYHDNKLELFKAVVKHFFIDRQKAQTTISYENKTLKEFINSYVDVIGAQMGSLSKAIQEVGATSASKAYIIMGLKLREYSEELNQEYTAIRNKTLANWIAAIQHAVASGEIKENADVVTLAEIFISNYLGLSIWESFQNGLNIEHLRYNFTYLYDLIKK